MSTPRVGEAVPEALERCTARDSEGREVRLGSLWREQHTLLVFLRHFGCIGCTENVALLHPRFHELAEKRRSRRPARLRRSELHR